MRKTITLFVLVVILLVGGFWFSQNGGNQLPSPFQFMPSFQKVQLITSDGVEIIGNYYSVDIPSQAVLFLHMMPATKESWDTLARALQERGIASLAIDLRGHGESTRIKNEELGIKNLDYTKFSEEEHQASRLDVEAGLDWLKKETGLELAHMSVVGASIGANLGLQALADHPEIRKGIALSPGLNYRGIEPKPLVAKLESDQEVLYATSKDDGDNVSMTEELFNATSAKKEWKVYDDAGHGTTMLERASDLGPSIIEFLTR